MPMTFGYDMFIHNGRHYRVDTHMMEHMDDPERQYKTIVYWCHPSGQVTDWGPVYTWFYSTYKQAVAGHKGVLNTFQPPLVKKWAHH